MMILKLALPVLACTMAALSPAVLAQTSPLPPAFGLQNPILPPPAQTEAVTLSLTASFAGETKVIQSGLTWTVFADDAGSAAVQPLVTSREANPILRLEPRSYLVHVTYGMASAMRRVTLTTRGASERITINAGALRLSGAIGQTSIPASRLNFSIYLPLPGNSEGKLIAGNVKAGDIVRLPEGTYHVVSNYGDTNAIMRADLRVDTGKMTIATLNHRAAAITLKLVDKAGAEALAGAAFSILTPGGDVIRELIGAFPSLILAEGEYIAIARFQGRTYNHTFKVESGKDREVEVLALSTNAGGG